MACGVPSYHGEVLFAHAQERGKRPISGMRGRGGHAQDSQRPMDETLPMAWKAAIDHSMGRPSRNASAVCAAHTMDDAKSMPCANGVLELAGATCKMQQAASASSQRETIVCSQSCKCTATGPPSCNHQ